MSSSKKSSALDDLMLAYTDLSGKCKKPEFKGPPVKDIKREAPKQVFQHSTKARDWRAFDQSLESVFGSSSVGATGHNVPTLGPTPTLAPAFVPLVTTPGVTAGSSEGDDWGEFQQFSSSQSMGCR